MNAWTIFTVAFAAVVVQAWISRKGSPDWYLGCIVPLAYGGVVAWMFIGEDFIRSLSIIVFGAAIPITLLISLGRKREEGRREEHLTDS